MSGAMRRIGEYLGLVEDTGRYDEYDDYGATAEVPAVRAVAPSEPDRAPVAHLSDKRRAKRPVVLAQQVSTDMARIVPIEPTTYNDARAIGEQFREGFPVIMNLTEMDGADAKRLVDFAAGLVFATRGSIERITSKVFLLSPPGVTVGPDEKAKLAAPDFFNQS